MKYLPISFKSRLECLKPFSIRPIIKHITINSYINNEEVKKTVSNNYLNCSNCCKYFNCKQSKNLVCKKFKPDNLPDLYAWLVYNWVLLGVKFQRAEDINFINNSLYEVKHDS